MITIKIIIIIIVIIKSDTKKKTNVNYLAKLLFGIILYKKYYKILKNN